MIKLQPLSDITNTIRSHCRLFRIQACGPEVCGTERINNIFDRKKIFFDENKYIHCPLFRIQVCRTELIDTVFERTELFFDE